MSDKILSISNLTVKLKSDNSIILNNINLDLFSGDVLALDGMNGSGKSTLLRIINSQTSGYVIESGEVIYYPFKEENILSLNEKDTLKCNSLIGYVPQKDNYEGLNRLSIEDLIDDAISVSNLSKEKAFELFNKYFKNNKKVTLKAIPAKLSGGEQRMVTIFLGLVCKPSIKLMVIDEPLNNLDFENAMRVSDLINQIHLDNPESAIIMVTHCKIITCVNRQRRINDGIIEENDSEYICHHCMGEPNCDKFYIK